MQTREQKYAVQIYEQVSHYKQEHDAQQVKDYGSMAHQLPVLVRSAGLVQALTFVEARGKPGHKQLLDHLAVTVGQPMGSALAEAARGADLAAYMRLTQQVLTALIWYKRFAQSVLEVAHSES